MRIRIKSICVELEPSLMRHDKGLVEMTVTIMVDHEKIVVRETHEQDEFENMFDVYFHTIQEKLRHAIKEKV